MDLRGLPGYLGARHRLASARATPGALGLFQSQGERRQVVARAAASGVRVCPGSVARRRETDPPPCKAEARSGNAGKAVTPNADPGALARAIAPPTDSTAAGIYGLSQCRNKSDVWHSASPDMPNRAMEVT